jgi:hypothetical protein
MKKWREKNLEQWSAYCEEYRKRSKSIINRIASSAKRRNIVFSDTDRDFFEQIVNQPCKYCGCESSGLDRVDSTIGYLKGNVVPSCFMCNLMKLNFDVNCFHDKIRKIVELNYDTISRLDERSVDWSTNFGKSHKDSSMKNNKDVLCSKFYLEDLKRQNCYLCGCNVGIGIDRINSKLPYSQQNCMPCCSMCNYMKKDFSLGAFLLKCYKIFKNTSTIHIKSSLDS